MSRTITSVYSGYPRCQVLELYDSLTYNSFYAYLNLTLIANLTPSCQLYPYHKCILTMKNPFIKSDTECV